MPATLTEPVRGVLRRVKTAVQDNHSKLRDAISAVRELEKARQTIAHECDNQQLGTDILARFDAEIEKVKARYRETDDFEDYLRLQTVYLLRSREAEFKGGIFARMQGYTFGLNWSEFARQRPEWKETLLRACNIKLGIACQEFDRVSGIVNEELAGSGFDEEQIAGDLRMRRVQSGVSQWRGAVNALGSVKPEDAERIWNRSVDALLSE